MEKKNKKSTLKKGKGITTFRVNTRIGVTKDLIPPDKKKPPQPPNTTSSDVETDKKINE